MPAEPFLPSFVVVAVGIAVVLVLIIRFRINAFIALITAALVVSFLSPGNLSEKVSRVSGEFGTAAGKIGLVIGFAAVIGEAMMRSGAADRIVQAFVGLLGEKRAPWALMSSGFVLSVPVFFDTVFYLLVPLARSLHRKTRKNFLLYVMAISAGGAITHTLVPPTPGPLAMAMTLEVSVGLMIVIGVVVAVPAAVCGMGFAKFLDSRVPIASLGDEPTDSVSMEISPEQAAELQGGPSSGEPDLSMSLWEAAIPVFLPVLLISGDTIVGTQVQKDVSNWASQLKPVTSLLGDPSLALLLSMAAALVTWVRRKCPDGRTFGGAVETALLSGGLVILITAAGGAFGAMLKVTNVASDINDLFKDSGAVGLVSLFLAFGMAALLKVAQGSSTTAMITVSAMMASMNLTQQTLGFNPVYLCTAIGAGSLIGSWMNDSGFWIVAKMSGLTETEALKTWTPLLLVLAAVSMGVTVVMSMVLPLA